MPFYSTPKGNSPVLSGAGAPAAGLGNVGDIYIDTTSKSLYGPKTALGWGSATSLAGAAGPQGAQGPQGPSGSTSWADITSKPTSFTPSSHDHGSLTNDGRVGTASGKVITTTTGGAVAAVDAIPQSAVQSTLGNSDLSADLTEVLSVSANAANLSSGTVPTARLASGTASASTYLRGDQTWAAVATYTLPAATTSALGGVIAGTGINVTGGTASVAYGNTLGTACQGNDSRLSDARSPLTHTHAAGDIASGTIATARLATGTASASTYLRGDQTWASIDSYALPGATASTLGGVIVGAGLGVTSGTVSVSYGTTTGTACQGDDSRLSDARAPTSHTHDAGQITSGALALASGSATSAAVQHSSSAGTGVFFPAAGSVAITASGAEAIRVDSSGRVLVGLTSTYSVANKLQTPSLVIAGADITAGGQIPSFVSRGSCWMGNADGSRGFGIATTTGNVMSMQGYNYNITAYNDLALMAGNFWQLYLGTNGRVGIQTNAATARLQVQGAGTGTGQTFSATNSSVQELLWCLDNGNHFSSAGRFASASDARFARYHARATTTNTAATTNLFLNGSSTNVTVSATSAYMFTVRLSAYSTTTNEAAGWFFRGMVRRNAASGTVLVGTVTKESWVESGLSGVDANVIADDSTETLRVQANGLASATIRWHAVIETSEVSFGAQ